MSTWWQNWHFLVNIPCNKAYCKVFPLRHQSSPKIQWAHLIISCCTARDQPDFLIPVVRWWNRPLNRFWPHTGFFHWHRGKAGSPVCRVLQTPGPKSTAHVESTNSGPFLAGQWCHLSPPYCNTVTRRIKERKPQRCVPLGRDEAFFSFPSGKWRLCVGRPVSRIHLLPSFNGVINKEKSLESIKNTAPNSHVTSVYEKEANALLSKS